MTLFLLSRKLYYAQVFEMLIEYQKNFHKKDTPVCINKYVYLQVNPYTCK